MENNTKSCKLRIPKDLSSKTPAFLVNFSNGNINSKFSDQIHFKNLLPTEDKNKTRRVLIASNGRLNYQSDPVEDNINKSKMCYYIGVRSKTSDKMKIYNAALFHLKPIRKTDSLPTTDEVKNTRERLDDLTASFGSKGKKRTMNARQKYSTSITPVDDTIEDLTLDDSLSHINNPVAFPNPSTSSIEYLPPQNREATSVDEVYRIGDIINSEDDKCLDELAETLLEEIPTEFTKWKVEGTYCEYVLRHLNSTIDYVKVKYLLYYDFLVKFSQLKVMDIRKKDPIPDIPYPIKSSLLESYTVTSQTESGQPIRSLSSIMKDKLLAYMLVLALFIDDYCVNLAEVQLGTKYGLPKIAKIAQVLGCHTTSRKVNDSAVQFAELKFPLVIHQKYYKKF